MEPGFYPDLSRADYDMLDAANFSTLKAFRRSAAHGRHAMVTERKPTPALILGDAIHACVLEEDRFHAEYVEGLAHGRRRKAEQEAWAQFELENTGKVILKAEEYEKCFLVREAVWQNPTALELLTNPGYTEASFVWHDLDAGLCKGRLDRFTKLGDWPVVADLKSTVNASEEGFPREIVKYSWHLQAAFYLAGLDQVSPNASRRFLFVAVEKEPPFATQVHELDSAGLEQGQNEINRLLRRYMKCRAENSYPGYPSGVNTAQLPPWAFKYVEEDDE